VRIKILDTDQLIAFINSPTFNYSLAANGSNLQVEVGGEFSFINQSGNCFSTNPQTQNGYSFNSQALPFEIIAETNQGDRLFRGFFEEYTTSYGKEKSDLKTTLIFNDCSRFLTRRPIVGKYRNTFEAILQEIVSNSGAAGFITPIIYKTSTTKALQAVKRIAFVSIPKEGDIIIVGKRKYKYVLENPTELELNIESDFGVMVNELVAKINASTDSECSANEDGMGVLLTGFAYNNNFLVYTDGVRIVNEILQDASSSNEDGTDVPVLDLHISVEFQGEDLRQSLEKLCQLALCNFYVDPKFGNLVIYQQQYYLDRVDSLKTLNVSPGVVNCITPDTGIIETLSYQEAGSSVNKIIVWGKNGEIPLPDLRLEDSNTSISTIDNIRRKIEKDTQVLDYFYTETATRVVQVKITPDEVQGGGNATCYPVEVSLDSQSGFSDSNDYIQIFNSGESGSDLNGGIGADFEALSQFIETTPDTEHTEFVIFNFDLTNVPADNTSKSVFIKLSSQIVFPYDSGDFGKIANQEINFYLYDPGENVILEKSFTPVLDADYGGIFAAQALVYLNDYKGMEIKVKAEFKITANFNVTPNFEFRGRLRCYDCDAIPVYLDTYDDEIFINFGKVNIFSAITNAGASLDPETGTNLYVPSRSGNANYKIDLRDPQYFIGIPYINLSESLNTQLGFGTTHAETTVLINGTEVSHHVTNAIEDQQLVYQTNIFLTDYVGDVIDVTINQDVSTGNDGNVRTVFTQVDGSVECMSQDCLGVNWEADGIFIPLASNSTRRGFRINSGDLGNSANGSFKTTLDVPELTDDGYSYDLLYVFDYSIFSRTSPLSSEGGVVEVYINDNLITTQVININTNAGATGLGLSAYAGQTINIEFRYLSDRFQSDFPTNGFIDFYPISICPSPQTVLPGDTFGNWTVSTLEGTNSVNHDVVLKNPVTTKPILATFIGNIGNDVNGNVTVNVYVNEILSLSLSARAFGSLDFDSGNLGGIIIFSSTMAGDTINIRVDISASGATTGTSQGSFEGKIYYA
jgi:hypothetical protein